MNVYLNLIAVICGASYLVNAITQEQAIQSDPKCFGVYDLNTTVLTPSCQSGSVIAIKDLRVGAKRSEIGCGIELANDTYTTCCQPSADDCQFSLDTSFNSRYHDQCNGQQSCNVQVQNVEVTQDRCGAADASLYPTTTNYMYMDYYCVEVDRVASMCSAARTATDSTVYLWSEGYPTGSIPTGSECTCSVELDNCEASVVVTSVLRELTGNTNETCDQQLTVQDSDGMAPIQWTCDDNSITVTEASVSSTYLTVRLNNTRDTADGNFWLGFRATSSSNLTLTCPAKSQENCIPTTTTTTTITTTTPTTTTTTPTTTTTTPSTTTTTPTTTTSTPTTTTTTPTTTPTTTTTMMTTTAAATTVPIAHDVTTGTGTVEVSTESGNDLTIIITAVAAGVVVIIAIIIGVICYLKKKRRVVPEDEEEDVAANAVTEDIPEANGGIDIPEKHDDTDIISENGGIFSGVHQGTLPPISTFFTHPTTKSDTKGGELEAETERKHKKKKKKKKKKRQHKEEDNNLVDDGNTVHINGLDPVDNGRLVSSNTNEHLLENGMLHGLPVIVSSQNSAVLETVQDESEQNERHRKHKKKKKKKSRSISPGRQVVEDGMEAVLFGGSTSGGNATLVQQGENTTVEGPVQQEGASEEQGERKRRKHKRKKKKEYDRTEETLQEEDIQDVEMTSFA